MSWILLLGLGALTGAIAGLFGLGGGILLVPALTLVGFPLVQAAAISLIGVLLSAISGTWRNWRAGRLRPRASAEIALFGIPTAALGAWIGDRIPEPRLQEGFALLILGAIALIWLRQREERTLETHSVELNQVSSRASTAFPRSYIYIGIIAGVLSGLFGIGGGIILVPLQMLLLAEPLESAAATSLGAVIAIASAGLAQHAWAGNVLWSQGLCVGVGGIAGAQLGVRLAPRLPKTLMQRLFRLLLLAVSLYLMEQGLASDLGW
jgi:uncharacterized membrane protein YfcA